jgi:hypothetical protein
MEEVEDIIPETIPEEPHGGAAHSAEFPEEVEVIPEPPPLKRATNKLKDKVTCEGCGKSMSLHAYKYSHKCKARAPDEPPKEVKKPDAPLDADVAQEARLAQLTEALKAPKKQKPATARAAMASAGSRAAMSDAQSQKPIRQKTVIQRTPEYIPPEPPYQPTQQDIYQHLIQQRQQQAYMRHQAMLAPYQNMFASRAR